MVTSAGNCSLSLAVHTNGDSRVSNRDTIVYTRITRACLSTHMTGVEARHDSGCRKTAAATAGGNIPEREDDFTKAYLSNRGLHTYVGILNVSHQYWLQCTSSDIARYVTTQTPSNRSVPSKYAYSSIYIRQHVFVCTCVQTRHA